MVHPLIVFLVGVACGGFIGAFVMALLFHAAGPEPEPISEEAFRHDR